MWSAIKMSINSTLGKKTKPLDLIIKESIDEAYYNQLERDYLFGDDRIFLYPRGMKKIDITSSSKDDRVPTILALPVGVEEIYATNGQPSVEYVFIPNGLKRIGTTAFVGWASLHDVSIPTTVTAIGDGAFAGCQNFKNMYIPDNVKSMGRQAFATCSNMESIIIGNGITKIEQRTFTGCSNLRTLYIQNTIKSIGLNAFKECTNLSDIYYSGTEEEFQGISVEEGNMYFNIATKHYNSEASG